MKIHLHKEQGLYRIEIIVETRNVETHSKMNDLSEQDKASIRQYLKAVADLIMEKINGR